ncbi:MAG: DUF2314 domain-containing protein [Myxococcota bacterium]
MDDKIIVGVPGPWGSRTELGRALAEGPSPRFLLAGEVLIDVTTNRAVVLEHYERDDDLAQAFSIAGGGRLSDETLAAIERHQTTAYILADPGVDGARQILAVASALLEAGGTGVKVETAGAAHDPERWRWMAERPGPLAAYDALVTLVGSETGAYSCGMRNFGLPDVGADVMENLDLAGLLTAFNQWQLLERPDLGGEAWFAEELDGPAFTPRLEPYGYEPGTSLNNPHGKWVLKPGEMPVLDGVQADGPLFVALPSDSEEVKRSVEHAQATLPRLRTYLADPTDWGRAMVKVHLVDGDESAHIWLVLVDADETSFTGQFIELPPEFASFRVHDAHTRPWRDLKDWAILRHGAMIGGFSLRLARDRFEPARRRWHELYTGALAFEPIEGLLERYAPSPR